MDTPALVIRPKRELIQPLGLGQTALPVQHDGLIEQILQGRGLIQ